MFSGIVEELGEVRKMIRQGRNFLLEVKAEKITDDVKTGDSISVNGACLTIIEKKPGTLSFEVMSETAGLTNLGYLSPADKVNLERSLKVGDRISGHFVTGHIDCTGVVRRRSYINNNLCFEIAVPTEFLKYCVSKGSVAVDGISLTLAGKKTGTFSVYIIPHTMKNTTLGEKGPSDKVNIEFDILAKKSSIS